MKPFLLLGAAALTLASCSLQKQTSNTAKTLGIYGAGVIQKPVLTNLKVNPQSFTSSYAGSGTQGIDYHKSQAIAKAMIETKADVIIEPAYTITQSGSGISIALKGYAGRYENFRPMEMADTSLLIDVGIIDYNNGPGDTPAPKPAKKKGKAGWILLALLVGGAAAASGGL
ncbi:MAG: hypothetical protein EOO45_10505 [Flavobacterium sp.]|nr:MAG: hypothetical protein EOO45_10505 [Flavobacterium sp.]